MFLSMTGACGLPAEKGDTSAGNEADASQGADERLVSGLRASATWANRTLTPAEIDSYLRTPGVLESFRAQRNEIALARLCWPETREMDRQANGVAVPEEDYRRSVRAMGLDPASIECPEAATDRPAALASGPLPARRSADGTHGAFREPGERFDAVLASSQAVYATLAPAVCDGLIQLPRANLAIAPIRRRWRGEVRIAAPDDRVLREEFQRVLSDPRLRDALGGLAVRLVDRDPNVFVRGLNAVERCVDADPATGACGGSQVGRCGGTRYRAYDRLAGQLTGGRRSYVRDASDFGATDSGSPVFGFTLSGGEGRIEGAICLLADEAVGGPTALGPAYSRRAKATLAAECVAHVLGLGGPPSSIRPRAPRSRRMLVTLDATDQVILSDTALTLLTQSYRR